MLSRYSVSQMFQADMVVMTHVEVFVIYWGDPLEEGLAGHSCIHTVCILREVRDSMNLQELSRLLYLLAKRGQAAWRRGPS